MSKQDGFSLVEVLLAVTIFGFITTALIGALVYGRSAVGDAGDHARAAHLADEGIQAVSNIKDADFNNLNDGTFGLVQSGNVWALSGSSDASGIYTRQITISSVDANRKNVTSTVSWMQGGSTSQVTSVVRLTNWSASLAKLWANATLPGSLNTAGTANGIKIATQGNYAYMVEGTADNALIIANVSNPAAPTLVSTLTMAASPTNIFVSGNYAYVTTSSDSAELQIVNITNPASPSIVATYNATGAGNGQAVFVSGTTAYLVRAANGGIAEFIILSVATPSTPLLLGSYGNNLSMNDIYVSGVNAYIGTNSTTQPLLVVNVSLSILPILTRAYTLATSGSVTAVTGFGDTLLLGQTGNLSVLDISNPSSVTRTGTLAVTGAAAVNDIALDNTNTFAFLGTGNTAAEFQIANIANPAAPTMIKTVDIQGTASALNGVAYNSTVNAVVGASASDTQELVTFVPN